MSKESQAISPENRFRRVTLGCSTEENAPYTFDWTLLDDQEMRTFKTLHRSLNTSSLPFLRFQIDRKHNPLLPNGIGGGFAGYLIHLQDSERILEEVARLHKNALDFSARIHGVTNRQILRDLDAFIYDPRHPIANPKMLQEIDTITGAIIARLRAVRSTCKDPLSEEYRNTVYSTADNLQSRYPLEITTDDNGIRWSYADVPTPITPLTVNGLTGGLSNESPSTVSLNTSLQTGLDFAQQLGRSTCPIFRILARQVDLV